MNIVVVDSPMGQGKTSWAISNMRKNGNPFIFFTPFLSECERIKQGVGREVLTPLPPKQAHFKSLIEEGKSIASTHALFSQISLSHEDRSFISTQKYDCYIDEAINAVEEIELNKRDFNILIKNYVEVLEDGKVEWIDDVNDNDKVPLAFSDIRDAAKAGSLYCSRNKMFLWLFPTEKFSCFDTIYILTYMFKSSSLCWMFNARHVDYKIMHVEKINDCYELIDGEGDYSTWKDNVRNLLHVYDGKLNLDFSLSASWYERDKEVGTRAVSNTMYNIARNVYSVKTDDCIWSCFKSKAEMVSPSRLLNKRNFVACNCRATNEYGDRHYLFYPMNIFMNPMIEGWLIDNGIKVNERNYALSQLLQWIWRSAIRNNEEIWLWLPSERMRKLLNEWLEEK